MKKIQKRQLGIISATATMLVVSVMALVYISQPVQEKKAAFSESDFAKVEGLAVEKTDQKSAEGLTCEQDKEVKRECGKCKKANATFTNSDCSTYTKEIDSESCIEACVSSASTVRTSVTVLP